MDRLCLQAEHWHFIKITMVTSICTSVLSSSAAWDQQLIQALVTRTVWVVRAVSKTYS